MRRFRPVNVHGPGMGANLDVITLTGYHAGGKGLWTSVYKDRGGFPKFNGVTKKRCLSWRPVGKGCQCRPQCASFSSRTGGTSKQDALASCEAKCKPKKRQRRRGR